ncbi:NAD-dependent epimerase/dehydratase family protein [Sphingomicrobium astaxanthinifaciens]|uniref:NAD-dependent epimerase/dehydratase family protein n=1 Tax=Sphingomicrobium astaxanthinifaciens TaxID=1227949 RepID=UPI001FCBD1FA|nr:NAD-dependent epimerase/dehydratase family protein [Sphingomicrobium astaxanthinifaciens]MCJ7420806.1 NAD-dependent epimerase/dehydratase family protein [Sphingomicrobium astaxanthinifaciens]
MTAAPLAVTGATGFVGSRLLEIATRGGLTLTCLTRRLQPERPGVRWIQGDLHDAPALAQLCEGARAVIHIAGVINASDAAGFERGNVEGTRNLLAAATRAGTGRFVHVSSLAAREPSLSLYGASKARSESAVRTSALDQQIVRPPAVYGPGDRETLELFRLAARGFVPLPPKGRLSLIHADDLVDLLLVLAEGRGRAGLLLEPDDGRPGGWTHEQFAQAIAGAVGRERVRTLSMPRPLVRLGAQLDRLVRGESAKLTPDRAAYFCHPDWTVAAEHRPDPALWQPAVATPEGLRDTAAWYAREGWLDLPQ